MQVYGHVPPISHNHVPTILHTIQVLGTAGEVSINLFRHSLMDSNKCTHYCGLIGQKILNSALYSHSMQSRESLRGNEEYGCMERDRIKGLCANRMTWLHTHTHLYIYIYIYISVEMIDFNESDSMMEIIQTTWQIFKNLTNITKRTSNETTSPAGIYSIPCKDCNKHYIVKPYAIKKKKNLWTQTINQNKGRSKHPFSYMLDVKPTFNFLPSHPNKKIPKTSHNSQSLSPKQNMLKILLPKLSLFFWFLNSPLYTFKAKRKKS